MKFANYLVIYISVLIIKSYGFKHGPDDSGVLTKTEAIEKCKSLSKRLMRYSEVREKNSQQEILGRLKDGESAWIDGYAKFSALVAFKGCYSLNQYNIQPSSVAVENVSVYSCITVCQTHKIYRNLEPDYLGLSKERCYCLKKTELTTMMPVKYSRCNNICFDSESDSCGGVDKLSIYKYYENDFNIWGPDEPSGGKCVYVHTKKGNETKAFSTPCFSLDESLNISGYYCRKDADYSLGRNCSGTYVNGQYCFVTSSSTRESARKGCSRNQGLLNELPIENGLNLANLNYWLGIYRPFNATENKTSFDDACLAVTKVDNTLHLDPDKCERNKFYLCHRSGYSTIYASTEQIFETTRRDTISTANGEINNNTIPFFKYTGVSNSSQDLLSTFRLSTSGSVFTRNDTLDSIIGSKSTFGSPLPGNNSGVTLSYDTDFEQTNELNSQIYVAVKPVEDKSSTLHKLVEIQKSDFNDNSLGTNSLFSLLALAIVIILVGFLIGRKRCRTKPKSQNNDKMNIAQNTDKTNTVSNEAEAYCITGENSVFRTAMSPNWNANKNQSFAYQNEYGKSDKAPTGRNDGEIEPGNTARNRSSFHLHVYDRINFV